MNSAISENSVSFWSATFANSIASICSASDISDLSDTTQSWSEVLSKSNLKYLFGVYKVAKEFKFYLKECKMLQVIKTNPEIGYDIGSWFVLNENIDKTEMYSLYLDTEIYPKIG